MSGEGAPVLVFRVGDHRLAVEASVVDSVEPMVEIVPLPRSPEAVCGLVEVEGEVVPVFSIRRRFAMPEREVRPEDFLVLARAGERRVALVAEEVEGVRETGPLWRDPEVGEAMQGIRGVMKTPDGLILIQDLKGFLNTEEEGRLRAALSREKAE